MDLKRGKIFQQLSIEEAGIFVCFCIESHEKRSAKQLSVPRCNSTVHAPRV